MLYGEKVLGKTNVKIQIAGISRVLIGCLQKAEHLYLIVSTILSGKKRECAKADESSTYLVNRTL